MTNSPFPRSPDGLPAAWGGDDGRLSQVYETRAQRVWETLHHMGFTPTFAWAGGQDGEGLLATKDGQEYLIAHMEDPREQARIDAAIADGSLREFLEQRMREDDAEAAHYAD